MQQRHLGFPWSVHRKQYLGASADDNGFKLDEDLVKSQQVAYSVAGVDEEVGLLLHVAAFLLSCKIL
jgi:hypothetical protein